jgi:hypothetical protein
MKTVHKSSTDKLHSVESAAEFLGGLSPATIRAWLTQKKLHRVKVGRRTMIRESELVTLIREEIAPVGSSARQNGAACLSRPTPTKDQTK